MPHQKNPKLKINRWKHSGYLWFLLSFVDRFACRTFSVLRQHTFQHILNNHFLKGRWKQQNFVLCAWVGLCLFVLNGKWEHLWTVKSHGRSADSTQTEENKYNGRLQLYPHHSARSQQPFSHEQMERTEMSYFQHLFTLIFCSFNDMILHDPPLESLSRHSSELRLGSGTKKLLVRVRKTLWFGLKYLFWMPQKQLEMEISF